MRAKGKPVQLNTPQPRSRKRACIAIFLALFALAWKVWADTTAVPVVHRTTIYLDGFPAGHGPFTVALISDIHVAGPDMPPERLTRIVKQINGLSPDLVLIAGDFISDKRTATRLYSGEAAVAPLRALDKNIIRIAVPGNHDHWYEYAAIMSALESAGFTVLRNEAVEVGPLAIGGLDDDYTGRADLAGTLRKMSGLAGGRVMLSHSPDPFPDLPRQFGVMLAGHTHCGQIRYPWGGSPATMSRHGQRYACGRTDENDNTIITGAGLGTSVLPVRLFSKAEIWLITIRPPNL